MTFPGGDSGEKPDDEHGQGPSGGLPGAAPEGAYEAPPIEQAQQPVYDTPSSSTEVPPGYAAPPAYGPPTTPPGYSQPGYPPPGYQPPPSYPPPSPGGYPPPGYQDPAGYPPGYPPPPPPPQYGGPPPGYGQPYQGGYPAPNYSGGYGPPAASGTNTMAIASLVASVVGVLCGIGSIVGIVLGAVALNQIKQTQQEGYGLAVAGIVVGIASLIINLVWTIFALR